LERLLKSRYVGSKNTFCITVWRPDTHSIVDDDVGQYVPTGLSKAEYEKIRDKEAKAKQERYAKNVAKAGKFIDFTDWYLKRGTELSGGWKKSVTLGHSMAKTKYDWSGTSEAKKFESVISGSKAASGSKPAPLKKVEKKVEQVAKTVKKRYNF
jgi:hypothetical protein